MHGITADRDEGGFYRDLAEALALDGVGSLRFDLRAHGQSEGAMEGADHGFVVPGDEEFVDPRTAAYRSRVIEDVTSWLSGLE